jgi:hypothetical protein
MTQCCEGERITETNVGYADTNPGVNEVQCECTYSNECLVIIQHWTYPIKRDVLIVNYCKKRNSPCLNKNI